MQSEWKISDKVDWPRSNDRDAARVPEIDLDDSETPHVQSLDHKDEHYGRVYGPGSWCQTGSVNHNIAGICVSGTALVACGKTATFTLAPAPSDTPARADRAPAAEKTAAAALRQQPTPSYRPSPSLSSHLHTNEPRSYDTLHTRKRRKMEEIRAEYDERLPGLPFHAPPALVKNVYERVRHTDHVRSRAALLGMLDVDQWVRRWPESMQDADCSLLIEVARQNLLLWDLSKACARTVEYLDALSQRVGEENTYSNPRYLAARLEGMRKEYGVSGVAAGSRHNGFRSAAVPPVVDKDRFVVHFLIHYCVEYPTMDFEVAQNVSAPWACPSSVGVAFTTKME